MTTDRGATVACPGYVHSGHAIRRVGRAGAGARAPAIGDGPSPDAGCAILTDATRRK